MTRLYENATTRLIINKNHYSEIDLRFIVDANIRNNVH